MDEPTEVWVERFKWPDRPHYGGHGWLLGEDDHGRWVGIAPDHPVYRGDEVVFEGPEAIVVCVPHDDWFMASWLVDHPSLELYVDIVTPPKWADGSATMVDLDFDVIVTLEGDTVLVDEDEFEAHRLSYGYPDDLVEAARAAAHDVYARVRRRDTPFSPATAAPWHEQLDRLLQVDR